MPEIRKVIGLRRQAITKLPPFVAVEDLDIGELKELDSLAGLERMVTLRRINWDRIELYPDAMKRMRELPELVELRIECYRLKRLPPGLAKLPSLISIVLWMCREDFDFADACKQIGASKTIRNVEIMTHKRCPVPDVLAPLKRVETLWLSCKTAPPSLWQLANLRSLTLFSHDRKVDLSKLTNLRELELDTKCDVLTGIEKLDQLRSLTIPQAFKGEIPVGVVAGLDGLDGPVRYAKKPAIPDDDVLHVTRDVPASFGPVRELYIGSPITNPLKQLADCARLIKLSFGSMGIEHVLPFLPSQLESLELRFQPVIPKLPPLPHLTELVIGSGGTKRLDVGGFPALRRLEIAAAGCMLVGLEKTAVEELTLAGVVMPNLTKLRVKKVDLVDMKDIDVAGLAAIPSLVDIRYRSRRRSIRPCSRIGPCRRSRVVGW